MLEWLNDLMERIYAGPGKLVIIGMIIWLSNKLWNFLYSDKVIKGR